MEMIFLDRFGWTYQQLYSQPVHYLLNWLAYSNIKNSFANKPQKKKWQ